MCHSLPHSTLYLRQKTNTILTATDINNALYRPVRTGTLYNAYMPPSDCSSKKLGNGDTSFAIQNMAKTAHKYQHHTRALTLKFFSGGNLSSLCASLHQFLYWHFQYAIDGDAQLLRSPACSWASRFSGIDCKSYTIFASTVLLNAGITHYMRRIKQAANPSGYTHVYIVVPKNQRTASLASGYYTIDGTINTQTELPYLQKDDILISPKNTKTTNTQLAAPADTPSLETQMQELLAQSYEISKENARTSTANRSWYFIVPAAKQPITASYRQLKIEPRTQRKGAYPYNAPLTFQQWLNNNVSYLQIEYGAQKAASYKAEMQPFEAQISHIRRNIYLPVVTQVTLEEQLQSQQEAIYLKYDTAYQQALKDEEKARIQAYVSSNQTFWKELTQLRTSRQLDERDNYDNIRQSSDYEASKRAKLENKKLLNLLLIGALGIGIIKAIK